MQEELKSATAAAKKKPPVQGNLLAGAVNHLLAEHSGLPAEWRTALNRDYTKANGDKADYSILQGQLNNYTKKNSFDYFIHKDLGGFLTRELDYYIKNELLDWDDLAALKHNPARLAPMLSKMEVIRQLGENIIAFLAQLENFQKKLWLKKKFVTETNYCITLDRLADHTDLLELVFDNENQLEDWEKLYALDLDKLDHDYEALSWDEFLAKPEYRYLMLDTRHFDEAFKAQLLATIEDLDDQCDGLLVHSENFQALNLLQERYKEQVKCIYIDPPYNTDASSIIYKNGYKHSSWASLLNDRLDFSRSYLKHNGVICIAIDDAECSLLRNIAESTFEKNIGIAVVRSNPQSRKTSGKFSPVHEYALFYGKSLESIPGMLDVSSSKESRYPLKDKSGRYAWMNFIRAGSNDLRIDRPKSYYPIIVTDKDEIRIPDMRWNGDTQEYDILENIEGSEIVVYPTKVENGNLIEKRWQRGYERVRNELGEYRVRRTPEGVCIDFKTRMDSNAAPTTWWDKKEYASSNYGTAELKNILDSDEFDFPKAKGLVKDCLKASGVSDEVGVVLDFFGGSGTTGQAVIELTRGLETSSRYVLVEMGDYFDTVLKPRIQKVVYADTWKAGSPVADKDGNMNGVSHCFKTIRLESYEDALGNLALNRQKGQQQLLEASENSDLSAARQSYVMNYMLEVETRGSASLLNSKLFVDPTAYQLNVRSASGDETKAVNIDLLETFNYLLGLTVEHIAAPVYFDAELSQGEFGRWQATVKRVTDASKGKWWFRTVYGTNRNGQSVLVVWRNLPSVIVKGQKGAEDEKGLLKDNAVLDAVLIEKLNIRLTASQDDEIDILYVNGDHNINIPKNRKGELMEQARIQLIEEAFHRLMFAGTESDLPGKV